MSDWSMIDTWIVLTGMVIAMSCALVGNFLVIRRMSLMGDAISHAVLPGLAVAFLLSGDRHPLPMFAGAVAAGLLTAFLTEWIRTNGRMEADAAMGVIFTTLFAIGLLLIVRAADSVDLDPGCVLYGAIELSPLDTVPVGPWEWPRAFAIGLVVLAINVVVIGLFYKELVLSSFDPEAAAALGFKPRRIYYLLMALVAVTAVASFESVGSILVIAMLIVPGVCGTLLARRLPGVLAASAVVAMLSAIGGHVMAIGIPPIFGFVDTSTSGSMAVAAGILFVGVFLVAPENGVLARWAHQRSLRDRIRCEDVLGALYRWHEEHGEKGPVVRWPELAARIGLGPTQARRIRRLLRRNGLIGYVADDAVHLTGEGKRQAAIVIRDHRLWEVYLHHQVQLPADHVHATSEALEHLTSDGMRRRLERDATGASVDPHGKVIP
ncbi:MAG TPA: metal ABC transporter permease [Kiritimatiellia bacterium]|nr:metal ABC transporter permease [Kiritimatiellia bacterium]HMP34890.1 metal ABC transporter permease [Kiritimatiellia bacterium]